MFLHRARIGAGLDCDGQVLVTHDLLGLFDRFTPRFVKRYAELHVAMDAAFRSFMQEVSDRAFPEESHSVQMKEEEWQALQDSLDEA